MGRQINLAGSRERGAGRIFLRTPPSYLLPGLVFCLLSLTGCVKRSILIESDPPGASVWINEHPMGTTPLTYEFITHGRYKFRLQKSGFQDWVARETVKAPVYQWIPLDFIAEFLLPVHLDDRHHFRYVLVPRPASADPESEASPKSDPARAALTDPDPLRRRQAALDLARDRDPADAEAARSAAGDPDPTVRTIALDAVRGIEGKKALDRLLEALKKDPSPEVRWKAATQLEALKDPRAVPGLIEALRDRDPLVRTGAAEALKAIPDPKAAGPLVRALRDKDPSVRRAAAEGLGLLGDAAAVKPLTKALFHHDVQTRRKAAKSLSQIKDPSSGPALVRTFSDYDPKVRQIATEALISFGDSRVVPTLIRYLRSWQAVTREHAALVLGGLKDPLAIEPLKRAFLREPNPMTSGAMLGALRSLGVKEDPDWKRMHLDRERKYKERLERKSEQDKKSAQQNPSPGVQ